MPDKITNIIAQLAHQLGVAAEHVYGVMVRQAIVSGVIEICVGVFLIVAAIILALLARHFIKRTGDDDVYDADPYAIGAVCVIIVAIVCSIFSLPLLCNGINSVANPEYYAIKDILDAIGK